MGPLFSVFSSIFICLSAYRMGVLVLLSIFPFSVVPYVGFGSAYYLPFVCGHTWVLVLVIVFPFSDVHY
jgi:hypothetical protein